MTKIRNPLALLAGLALMAPALALAWPSSYYGSSPQAQARDGAMPAPIKRRLGSSFGIKEKLFSLRWSFLFSKNER